MANGRNLLIRAGMFWSCLALAHGAMSGSEDRASPAMAESSGGGEYLGPTDEMTPEAHAAIQADLQQSIRRLEAEGRLARLPAKGIANFGWPLRLAPGRTDFQYHGISNFVDENPAFPDQVLDYNCGTRSYDLSSGYNHKGTDIFNYPFPWKKMDEQDVIIVAGASGTIIQKSDGNYDRNCAIGSGNWNAVYVRHDDQSVAWYGHMKNGSTTVKAVGERVEAGEYLGTVGSSGSSTGPHLHLELYDANNALVDPWLGACNSKSQEVTWASQRPYFDTGINKITVGPAVAQTPTCPTPEVPNESDYIAPGTTAYFTVYARDQTSQDVIAVRWYRPDGSLFSQSSSGTPSAGQFYAASWWWWSRTVPATPTGAWRFEATVGGQTYSKTYFVGGSPAYGAPASIAVAPGTPGSQIAPPGSAFVAPLSVQVLDAQGQAVTGARVDFTVPASGATAVLSSRTALTDAQGIASVSAVANSLYGSYVVQASVLVNGAPVSQAFQMVNGVSYLLGVIRQGSGLGVVTSASPGIDCGTDCSETYPQGSAVLLTAAADARSRFVGWLGDCSGPQLTCSLNMSGARSVTARFEPKRPLSSVLLLMLD